MAKPKEPRHVVITRSLVDKFYAQRKQLRQARAALNKREKRVAQSKRSEALEERARRNVNARPRSD